MLQRVGLLELFDVVIDSAVEGVEKPDPRIFHLALERTGAAAEDVVYAGDIYSIDVVGARAAGIRPVLVDEGDLYPEADCPRVRSLAQLAEHLAPGTRRGERFSARLRGETMSPEKDPFAQFLKHFDAGSTLFEEGDDGEELYIVRSGKVAIKKKVPHGEVTLAILEKGDFFGEMAMLEHIPRTAGAEMAEDGKLIVIDAEIFGELIKANPEIAVRMLRKYSLRLRETTKQIEDLAAKAEAKVAIGVVPEAEASPVSTAQPSAEEEPAAPQQTEAMAYFISKASGNVFPVFKNDALIGRYDSVTGSTPEIDLTQEDAARNISRRHARLVTKDGKHFVAEEIGTMNGTFLNSEKIPTGVLTPINDGDELTLCRLSITFRVPGSRD